MLVKFQNSIIRDNEKQIAKFDTQIKAVEKKINEVVIPLKLKLDALTAQKQAFIDLNEKFKQEMANSPDTVSPPSLGVNPNSTVDQVPGIFNPDPFMD